jgi:S-(hydroxymethyl)mycothiol dehydrogenase
MDRGLVATARGEFALAALDVPRPAPDEVLVSMEACGVCRSDLHVVETGWAHPFPVLLGHEGAGIVEEVGSEVHHLVPGDRVILGWRAPCGRCRACARGDPRRCRRPVSAASRPFLEDGREVSLMLGLGSLASRVVVHGSAAVAYPRDLAPSEACLIGCCVATGIGSVLETARLSPGTRVAVIGCGAVGLCAVQGARLAGAEEIFAVDIDPQKAEAARRFGATTTGGGERLDAVFDVVGTPDTFTSGIEMLGSGGAYVLVGVPSPAQAELELQGFFDRRLRVLVSHGGDHLPAEDFPRLAARALSGEIDLNGLVSQKIALDDFATAFADLRAGRVVRSIVTDF